MIERVRRPKLVPKILEIGYDNKLKRQFGKHIMDDFDMVFRNKGVGLKDLEKKYKRGYPWASLMFKRLYGMNYTAACRAHELGEIEKIPEGKKKSFLVSIPESVRVRLDAYAESHSMTRNALINDLINDLLNDDGWNKESFF